jgi:hypothetical protein
VDRFVADRIEQSHSAFASQRVQATRSIREPSKTWAGTIHKAHSFLLACQLLAWSGMPTIAIKNFRMGQPNHSECGGLRHSPQKRIERKAAVIITVNKGNTRLPAQGVYATELQSVTYRNGDKDIVLGFAIEGVKELVPKIAPASFALGPLKEDCQTLNGRPFTEKELQQGVDPESLKGKSCQVILVHKKTSGKKLTAVVSVIMPASGKVETSTQETAVASATNETSAPVAAKETEVSATTN